MGSNLTYPAVDLKGKVAIVTGGNTGIGYETAKGLARLGAHTFIGCRSKERAENAIERMKHEVSMLSTSTSNRENHFNPEGDEPEVADENEVVRNKDASQYETDEDFIVEYLPLDLASFESTKECVHVFKKKGLPLHILVNNAAVAAAPYSTTPDGLESHFQINHLCPMLLTLELLPILLETAAFSGDGRIVFVSSNGHRHARQFSTELMNQTEEQYSRLWTYCDTKLYNIMTGYCLQRRLPNRCITVSSLCPGYVNTEIYRGIQDRRVITFFHKIAVNTIGRTTKEGAATCLNCAVSPELNSQQHFYYRSCRQELSSPDSRNKTFQEELWVKSLEFLKDHLSSEVMERYGPLNERNTDEPEH